MGFFDNFLKKSTAGYPSAELVARKFGKDSLSPQVIEIEALFSRVATASEDQIRQLPKVSTDIEAQFPGFSRAFDGVFSAALASGRFDAICEYQDRIGNVALGRITRQLDNDGFDNGFAIVSIQTLTSLYMRDWIDRPISESEFKQFNNPPFFEISKRVMEQNDYETAISPWVKVFGRVHPLDN